MNGRFPGRRQGLAAALVLIATLLAGCASGNSVKEVPQVDDRMERTIRIAHVAFHNGHYAQALALYRQAADLAYERDDVNAAVDAQYNAAVCLVRMERVNEADTLFQRTRAEIDRAGQAPPVELDLLEATIRYRQQRYREGLAIADAIVVNVPGSPAAQRAQFLRGLILAEQGDEAGLRASIVELDAGDDERLQADARELAGHLALLQERYQDSMAAFAEAARLRSAGSDYRGTVRALARAGEASEAAGDAALAAVHYLRAGRSALQQGARERARDLLIRARAMARQAGDMDTAREAQIYLKELQESEPEPTPGG